MKKLFALLVVLVLLTSCESSSAKAHRNEIAPRTAPNYELLTHEGVPYLCLGNNLTVKFKKIITDKGDNDIIYSLYVDGVYEKNIYCQHSHYKNKEFPIQSIVDNILQAYTDRVGDIYEPFEF